MTSVRFEPTTHGLGNRCSIQLSYEARLKATLPKLALIFNIEKSPLLPLIFDLISCKNKRQIN